MPIEIPDKTYFKIGEVSRILGVEPYNIRYWESQFPAIRPAKTKSKQRLYRRKDIELLLRIKTLLYEEGYTISGAKRRLKTLAGEKTKPPAPDGGLAAEERRAYDGVLADAKDQAFELTAKANNLTLALEEQRVAHRDRLERLAAERGDLLARLEAAEGTTQSLESARRELEVAETHERDRLAAAEAEKDLLRQALSEARAELASLRQARNHIETSSQTEVAELTRTLEESQVQLETAQTHAGALSEQNQVLEQRLAQAELDAREASVLREHGRSSQTRITELQARLLELTSALELKRRELESAQSTRADIKSQLSRELENAERTFSTRLRSAREQLLPLLEL